MATLNRRSFLKFLSVSPAIFHASSGFGKIFHDFPKELLSTSELYESLSTDKSQIITGTIQYNIQTDTLQVYNGNSWIHITQEKLQND